MWRDGGAKATAATGCGRLVGGDVRNETGMMVVLRGDERTLCGNKPGTLGRQENGGIWLEGREGQRAR